MDLVEVNFGGVVVGSQIQFFRVESKSKRKNRKEKEKEIILIIKRNV